jgi:hypothetical protein
MRSLPEEVERRAFRGDGVVRAGLGEDAVDGTRRVEDAVTLDARAGAPVAGEADARAVLGEGRDLMPADETDTVPEARAVVTTSASHEPVVRSSAFSSTSVPRR